MIVLLIVLGGFLGLGLVLLIGALIVAAAIEQAMDDIEGSR